ncbi:MAG: hypothetical protein AAB225_27940 [Acidobacteriota bacterium]
MTPAFSTSTSFPGWSPPFYELFFFPNSGTNTIQDLLNQPWEAVVQPNMIAPNLRDA